MPVREANIAVLPAPTPLIGGQRYEDPSAELVSHKYAATGKHTVDVTVGSAASAQAAVADAHSALPHWRALAPNARRRLMLKLADLVDQHAEELTDIQVVENGTPRRMAANWAPLIVDDLQYFAGWSDKVGGEIHPVWPAPALDYSVLEPYGVVAIIIPWNSPLFSVGAVVAPALAAGNCVVVKPPELTPFTSLRLAELALEAGFPPGVINVVPGGAAAGSELVSHPGVEKIHFTGSGPTAQRILAAAAANFTPVALELGGKSANLVFEDADLDRAVEQAVIAALALSGQACVAGTRLLVQDRVYDDVVNLCAAHISALPLGDPTDESTFLGPLISGAACDRVLGFVERARADGRARIVAGGGRLGDDFAGGFYVAPTLIADVPRDAEIAREEIFGPVLSVQRFSDEADAIELANDSPYGLAAYVQTSDVTRAHRVAAALEAGVIWVNGLGGLPPSIPFGGYKHSGVGRLGGRAGLEEFTRTKNVWIPL